MNNNRCAICESRTEYSLPIGNTRRVPVCPKCMNKYPTLKEIKIAVRYAAKVRQEIRNVFGVTSPEVHSRKRSRELVYARDLLMVFNRRTLGAGVNEAGLAYRRDHSTVIHATKKITDLLRFNKEYRESTKEVFKLIRKGVHNYEQRERTERTSV